MQRRLDKIVRGESKRGGQEEGKEETHDARFNPPKGVAKG
jgi:hypothetical protein